MGEEINITYESLFEILRREKGREDLQKLSSTFLQDVANYLAEKEQTLGKGDGFFSEEEREKNFLQYQNIKKMLKEIYDRREKKILILALMKSRTEHAMIDTSVLLEQESQLLLELQAILFRHRDHTLHTLLNTKKSVKAENRQQEPMVLQEKAKDLKADAEEVYEKEVVSAETAMAKTEEPAMKQVRFLHAVPKFVGKNLEVYGPFQSADVANLPAEIASVLIQKEKVEDCSSVGETPAS
ncbi:DNA replication complex GINS family protein [Candidatus Woesearchaeota archaeon]|nr:DNA replication complex GINS family protein [Candidatus Woesearchaeota archaeon]